MDAPTPTTTAAAVLPVTAWLPFGTCHRPDPMTTGFLPVHRTGPGEAVPRRLPGPRGFEVGDTLVLEAKIGAHDPEPLVEGAVVGDELTDSLSSRSSQSSEPDYDWLMASAKPMTS